MFSSEFFVGKIGHNLTEYIILNFLMNIPHNDPSQTARSRSSIISQLEAETDHLPKSQRRRIVTWSDRDAMIESCIEFGLSMTDVRNFSLSWPQPIAHLSHVHERVQQLGLATTFKRRNRKRIGYHNQAINKTFLKIASQLMERGWRVERFTRETKVYPFSPIRPDWYLEAVKGTRRLPYPVEIQASKSKFTLWQKKLKQYVHLYEEFKKHQPDDTPPRVLILVHSPDELTRARQGARDALSRRPNLNLFLFALIDEIELRYPDVVSSSIWQSCWDMPNWTLLP